MKNSIVASINSAIENNSEILFKLETGTNNGILTACVPDAVDYDGDSIIVYSGHNIYTVDITNAEYEEEDDTYIFNNEVSRMTISFAA